MKVYWATIGGFILVLEFIYFWLFKQTEFFGGFSWVILLMIESPITYLGGALVLIGYLSRKRY